MNTSLIWIGLPLISAGLIWTIRGRLKSFYAGGAVAFVLTLAALLFPIDSAINIGTISFKISTTLTLFGRQFILSSSDLPVLVFLYGSLFLWIIFAGSLGLSQKFVIFGLLIVVLQIASLAVEPFLYAALLMELAVLIALPLLFTEQHPSTNRGIIRFLIIQTLAMPFILFSGWLISGIEANPGNPHLINQASIFLGLGFALLLAIFPFHSWIPCLLEDSHPYAAGFILWIFPIISTLFAFHFLDRYAWLRNATSLLPTLQIVGTIMLVSAGFFSLFQKNLGRIFGFVIIAENGLSLLAISLGMSIGGQICILLLIPRTVALIAWSYSLSIIRSKANSLNFNDIKGLGKSWIFSTAGLAVPQLALAGLPILAGFPIHHYLLEALMRQSTDTALWFLIGELGIVLSGFRSLSIFIGNTGVGDWKIHENRVQQIFISAGLLTLLLLGLFPSWAIVIINQLPKMFEFLGY